MKGSHQGSGGKRGSSGREVRLAAKLRENLVRRKEKTRAIDDAAGMRIEITASRRGDGARSQDEGDQGS